LWRGTVATLFIATTYLNTDMSHRRRDLLRVAASATALALAGCGDDGGAATPTATPAGTPAPTETVTMFDSAFQPAELGVDSGTRVIWENSDDYRHTVTAASDNWSFDVEVPAEDTASHVFEADGAYEVYCRFHGSEDLTGMSMRIAVGDATIPADG
jgi:plastocyanin